VTSFHHQPEAQHPKSSAIHKLPADYPIYRTNNGQTSALARDGSVAIDSHEATFALAIRADK
jgi:hypothetical protein